MKNMKTSSRFPIVVFLLAASLMLLACGKGLIKRKLPQSEYTVVKKGDTIISKNNLNTTDKGKAAIFSFWKFQGIEEKKLLLIYEEHLGQPKAKPEISEKKLIPLNGNTAEFERYKLEIFELDPEILIFQLQLKN